MSERRWGRVTVEGWIDERPSVGGQVSVRPENSEHPTAFFYGKPTVEFLPEPVQFKDGDVYRFHGSHNVWARHGGVWQSIGDSGWQTDQWVNDQIRKGNVYRLVPEANGD